jgi:hypothetical protein
MKCFHLFLGLIIGSLGYGQTACEDANSYLVSAYSHVKKAYEANNISHLKYYANRSLQSFKSSKKDLVNCGCTPAIDLSEKAIDLLAKVESAKTYEDGRFFVKRARGISKESMVEIDKCAIANYNKTQASANNNVADNANTESLQQEKQQLLLTYNDIINNTVKAYNKSLGVCSCNHNKIKKTKFLDDLSSLGLDNI